MFIRVMVLSDSEATTNARTHRSTRRGRRPETDERDDTDDGPTRPTDTRHHMTRRTTQTRPGEQTRRPTDEEEMEAPLVPVIDTHTRQFDRIERTQRPTDEEDAEAPLVPLIDASTDAGENAPDVRREIADLKSQLNRIEATLGGTR